MTTAQALLAAFAPAGALRAAINVGNPILAHINAATGAAGGVSVDLAAALAQGLGVALELKVFDTAAKSVQAVTDDQADVGFFAVDPLRGAGIAFTAPYVLIEGCYMVRADSPVRANADVDQPGRSVVVGTGSAYDLFLTRALKQATILRAPSSPAVVDFFLQGRAEVAAGIRQQLAADASRLGGLRLLDGRFMVIQQAMGMPRSRGAAAAAYLANYVEAMKASGFVAEALARHGIAGASVAPAEPSVPAN
jgi:polar amino acid transport system substrate-binding protein